MGDIVIFHAPQDVHILLPNCPPDLIRFECIVPTTLFAHVKIIELENKYAPRNPSGYPATVYHYCSLSDWNEYWSGFDQLSFQ